MAGRIVVSQRLGTQAHTPLELGGPGSGNRAHAGRPGQIGGSQPRSSAMSIRSGRDWQARQAVAKQKTADDGTGITLDSIADHFKTADAPKQDAKFRAAYAVLDGYEGLREARESAESMKKTGNSGYTAEGHEYGPTALEQAIDYIRSVGAERVIAANIERAARGQSPIVQEALRFGVSTIRESLTPKERTQLSKAKQKGLLEIDVNDSFGRRLVAAAAIAFRYLEGS